MTYHLPLDPTLSPPSLPTFLVSPANPASQLAKAVQAIMKAKRIVVICGAGISVQAGIPDFRSPEGLFQTIKRDNPKEAMSSGKELFDVSVFNSEQKTSLFCQMIAQLSYLSRTAEPTSFHNVLRSLDDRGRLLRVYTQNIDAIEEKCGLSFGIPEFDDKRYRTRSKGKAKATEEISVTTDDNGPIASTSRLPSPPLETPRCIPLHGTLQSMHCQVCNHSFPLLDYLPSLSLGQPPPCPECTQLEATRKLIGKRPRGIGKLRPGVVLYNEAHKDGEGVGNAVQKDLIGSSKGKGRSGADLLLVVGTSLRVPGTKRMVREFAKAVRSRGISSNSKDEESTPRKTSGLATPSPSPRRTPTDDDEITPKAVYLNLDFPMPTREWEGVFDAWIQGDAQQFAEVLHMELEKEAKAKESALKKKQKKQEEAAQEQETFDCAGSQPRAKGKHGGGMTSGKRKSNNKSSPALNVPHSSMRTLSGKRRKTTWPPSPPYTPLSRSKRRLLLNNYEKDVDMDEDEEEIIDVVSTPSPPKLMLRIPSFQARQAYFAPEVYIRSKAPHYVRPRPPLLNTRTALSYARRRSSSPSLVDDIMDVSIDQSLSRHQVKTNHHGGHVTVAPSPSSSSTESYDNDEQYQHRDTKEARRRDHPTYSHQAFHSPPSSAIRVSLTRSNVDRLGGKIDHGHLTSSRALEAVNRNGNVNVDQ